VVKAIAVLSHSIILHRILEDKLDVGKKKKYSKLGSS